MDRKDQLIALLRAIAPDGDLGNLKAVREVRERAASLHEITEATAADGAAARPTPAQAVDRLLDDPDHLGPDDLHVVEAIILPAERPVVVIAGGKYDPPDWNDGLLGAPAVKGALEAAIPAVGRVELDPALGLPYGGTAFLVGGGLMMTNRHVASLFARGLGRGPIGYVPGTAGVDLLRERGRPARRLLEVTGVRLIHPYWDMALVEVRGDLGDITPLRLSALPPAEAVGRPIAAVGYPALDPRNDLDVQRQVFGDTFEVKRLMPGLLRPPRPVRSYEQVVSALCHDASTLGGASGSAVVDLETGEVVGLHFGGVYLDSNFSVPTWALLADARVTGAGVEGARIPTPPDAPWEGRWAQVESETPRIAAAPTAGGGGRAPRPGVDGPAAVTLDLPLRITVSLGDSSVTAVAATIAGAARHPGRSVGPPGEPPPWPTEAAVDPEASLRARFAEDAEVQEGLYSVVEAPGITLGRADVRLIADEEDLSLRHLATGASPTPFRMTAEVLERLVEHNRFGEGLRSWGGDLVLFGLRGCRLLADGDAFAPERDLEDRLGFASDTDRRPARLPLWGSTNGFVSEATLVEDRVTHVLPRCLIGVWRRSTREFALVRGTTTPNWDYTASAITKRNGNDGSPGDANLMLTGLYRYHVGRHKEIPDAFRLADADHGAARVASSNKREITYTVRDRYWNVPSWPSQDNLHPSMAGEGSAVRYIFHYSAGCTTIQGTFDHANQQHKGAWAELRGWAGLQKHGVDHAAVGRPFSYVLLTGREARLAAEGAPGLGRLRYGSRGAEVTALQRALERALGRDVPPTGKLDGPTQAALVLWQWTRGLHRASWDAIVTPAEAALLGLTLP